MIYTGGRHYTPLEVIDELSGFVLPENAEVLVGHLSDPNLSGHITGFEEIEGIINFKLTSGHTVAVNRKERLLGY